MDDFDDILNKLKEIRDALPAVLLETATSMSLTAKAVAERTIKDKGFGASYSSEKYPVWFLDGKELNKTGIAFIESVKKGVKDDEVAESNWAEFRGAQGLQNKYVDLTYTGKMWAGMFPQEARIENYNYIAPLGHNNLEGQKKMDYNFKRYGDFIGSTLTGDNLDLLYTVMSDEIYRLIDEKLM